MCIGIPMQVISSDEHVALCDNQGQQEQVDITLVGTQPTGTWLLVFLGAAREVMQEEIAKQTLNAVSAMQSIMQGENNIDYLFADLVDREPQLPEHLQVQVDQAKQTANQQSDLPSEQSYIQPTKEATNNV